MQIFYCDRCGMRISDDASRVMHYTGVYCRKCVALKPVNVAATRKSSHMGIPVHKKTPSARLAATQPLATEKSSAAAPASPAPRAIASIDGPIQRARLRKQSNVNIGTGLTVPLGGLLLLLIGMYRVVTLPENVTVAGTGGESERREIIATVKPPGSTGGSVRPINSTQLAATPVSENHQTVVATLAPPTAAPAVSPPAVPNLVRNPGFEDWMNAWTTYNTPVVFTAENVHSGAHAVLLKPNSGVFQEFSSLTPNTAYVLTAWVKVDEDFVYLGVKNHGGAEQSVKLSTANYTQANVRFTTGPKSNSALIYLWKDANAKGNAWGDDFSLTADTKTVK